MMRIVKAQSNTRTANRDPSDHGLANRLFRLSIRNLLSMLLILLIMMVVLPEAGIGYAEAQSPARIILENADSVHRLNLTAVPQELQNIAGEVSPRIFIESAGAVHHRDLKRIPQELQNIAGNVSPRIFIESAGAVHHRDLKRIPQELQNIAGEVSPRIFIESAGAVHHRDLAIPAVLLLDPQSITVTPATATLNVTETQQFRATVLPAGADQRVTWSVTNVTGTGTIDATGFFRGISVGTVNVTARSVVNPNITRNATVTVRAPLVVPPTPPTAITITPPTARLNVTEIQRFRATVLPVGVNQNVRWNSSNTTVGTINATGFFTARAAGTTIITARSVVDSSITRTATVTVIKPISARIDNYTVSPRNVTVGKPITINFTFTNTGTAPHIFGAGATLRRPDGTRVNFLTPVTVAPGESRNIRWTHTIDMVGRWDTAFGVWKESTHPLRNPLVQTGWIPKSIISTLGAEHNSPPHANFTFQVDALTVRLISTSTDPDNNIVSYHWKFGDGRTSREINPTHTFKKSGNYMVVHTVTDAHGRIDSVTKEMKVISRIASISYPPSLTMGFNMGIGIQTREEGLPVTVSIGGITKSGTTKRLPFTPPFLILNINTTRLSIGRHELTINVDGEIYKSEVDIVCGASLVKVVGNLERLDTIAETEMNEISEYPAGATANVVIGKAASLAADEITDRIEDKVEGGFANHIQKLLDHLPQSDRKAAQVTINWAMKFFGDLSEKIIEKEGKEGLDGFVKPHLTNVIREGTVLILCNDEIMAIQRRTRDTKQRLARPLKEEDINKINQILRLGKETIKNTNYERIYRLHIGRIPVVGWDITAEPTMSWFEEEHQRSLEPVRRGEFAWGGVLCPIWTFETMNACGQSLLTIPARIGWIEVTPDIKALERGEMRPQAIIISKLVKAVKAYIKVTEKVEEFSPYVIIGGMFVSTDILAEEINKEHKEIMNAVHHILTPRRASTTFIQPLFLEGELEFFHEDIILTLTPTGKIVGFDFVREGERLQVPPEYRKVSIGARESFRTAAVKPHQITMNLTSERETYSLGETARITVTMRNNASEPLENLLLWFFVPEEDILIRKTVNLSAHSEVVWSHEFEITHERVYAPVALLTLFNHIIVEDVISFSVGDARQKRAFMTIDYAEFSDPGVIEMKVKVENVGNLEIKPHLIFGGTFGNWTIKLPSILPQTSITETVSFSINDPGIYTANFTLTEGAITLHTRQADFTVRAIDTLLASVSTDNATYNLGDTVHVSVVVENVVFRIVEVPYKLEIITPSGQMINVLNFVAEEAGTYIIRVTPIAKGHAVISDETIFMVERQSDLIIKASRREETLYVRIITDAGGPVGGVRVTANDLVSVTDKEGIAKFEYMGVRESFVRAEKIGFNPAMEILPTNITITPETATLNVTETQQFNATVLPPGANQSVLWSVTNITGTGTINATGFFRALSAGTVNVTARSVVDRNITGNATVTIRPTVVPTPKISSFAPPMHVNDTVGARRTFNITIDQIANVRWLINGRVVETDENVIEASYTNTSASFGTWNVSAVITNPNGTAMQTWIWNVSIHFTLELNAGWNMVSIPVIPDNRTVQAIFGNIPTLRIRPIVTWMAPRFVEVDEIHPKTGYWVFSPRPMKINITGREIENETLSLSAGWNMVGTAGMQNFSISKIPNQVPIRPAVTWKAPSFVNTEVIEPGSSAWVFVTRGTIVNQKQGKIEKEGVKQIQEITREWFVKAASGEGWNVTINATNQLEPVTFGINPVASDEFDEYDRFSALPIMERVIMALDGLYATQINREKMIWNLTIGVPIGQSTTLTWNSSKIPDALRVTLNDIDMRLQSSLTLTEGSYEFIIKASPVLAPPRIISFAPPSPVSDTQGAIRTFNITINQIANVRWLINGRVVETDENVMEASYTNTSASFGIWNVSAIVTNPDGTNMQTWTWNVTAVPPVAPPIVVPNIISFAPTSPVSDTQGARRTFNITMNQIANVRWLINERVIETDENVIEASYTNISASFGIWNVSAIVTNPNGTDMQSWIWNVTAAPPVAPPIVVPNIISFAPTSPVSDTQGARRTFNITINQIANVRWLINGRVMETDENVIEASYTNISASFGIWNVSAIVTNPNGTDMQSWIWNVTASPLPAPTPCYIATATYGTPLDERINVLRDFRDTILMTNPVGKAFVSIYYTTSPPIADTLRGNDELRTVTRLTLITPLVYLSWFALSDLWVVFIIGLIAILLLRNDRKKILKSLLSGTIVGASSILIFIAAIFLFGFAGYILPFFAVIGAYMLPFVIPMTIVFTLYTVFKTWHKNHTEC